MRASAITGIVTAALMPSIMVGSLMRATPPSRRMSAGARSSAMTAAARASSAIFACSGVTTSMITPPLSISARPDLTLKVPVSIGSQNSTLPLRRRARTAPVLPGLGAALLEQPHVEEVIQLLPAVALRGGDELSRDGLLQAHRFEAVRIGRLCERVDAVGEGLDERQQGGVRAHERRAVGRVVELVVGELPHLGQCCVGYRDCGVAPVARQLDRAH